MSNEQPQGLSLLDLDGTSERVQVGTKAGDPVYVEVFGVSAKGVVEVFRRFPEVMKWFKGGGNIDIKNLVNESPDALAAIIAAGVGEPGNQKSEAKAARLSVEVQVDIIEAIGRQTFALHGFGPFAEKIIALAGKAQAANFGRGLATKSPPVSTPSSPPVTPPNQSGS